MTCTIAIWQGGVASIHFNTWRKPVGFFSCCPNCLLKAQRHTTVKSKRGNLHYSQRSNPKFNIMGIRHEHDKHGTVQTCFFLKFEVTDWSASKTYSKLLEPVRLGRMKQKQERHVSWLNRAKSTDCGRGPCQTLDQHGIYEWPPTSRGLSGERSTPGWPLTLFWTNQGMLSENMILS